MQEFSFFFFCFNIILKATVVYIQCSSMCPHSCDNLKGKNRKKRKCFEVYVNIGAFCSFVRFIHYKLIFNEYKLPNGDKSGNNMYILTQFCTFVLRFTTYTLHNASGI